MAAKKSRSKTSVPKRTVASSRDPEQIWNDVEYYIRGVTLPEHPAPQVKASPAEPAELAAWRAIVRYRDWLVLVATKRYLNQSLRDFCRTATTLGATDKQLKTLKRRLREVRADDATRAALALKELDAALAKRERHPRNGPPDKLIEKLHEPKLRAAVGAVEAWLKNKAQSDAAIEQRARLALREVDRRNLLADGTLQGLEAEIRKLRRNSDGTGALNAIARWMVAKVAGLPRDTLALRPRRSKKKP